MDHTLYLRRRGKILLPVSESANILPLGAATAFSMSLEGLGYALSPALLEACRNLTFDQLDRLYGELITALMRMVGADKQFDPMYSNFPRQVMETDAAELYFNALVHYWSGGQLFPVQRKKLRPRLQEPPRLNYIDLGTREEFESLFTQITASNVSVSAQDQIDLEWFVRTFGDDIERLVPENVPQKENAAFLSVLFLNHTKVGERFVRERTKTVTDVLRLANPYEQMIDQIEAYYLGDSGMTPSQQVLPSSTTLDLALILCDGGMGISLAAGSKTAVVSDGADVVELL